ncbi:hypothetical protein QFC19_006434 [Naganishia cerealis]|uniref:Uncharacterized protein n=1 Tax=Naganishia cerealis TaxID=610337 RepID=A0ACC2VHC2_9TREE|nr:hypothetical protein QFC19_006434 [Naganishia cerealis]
MGDHVCRKKGPTSQRSGLQPAQQPHRQQSSRSNHPSRSQQSGQSHQRTHHSSQTPAAAAAGSSLSAARNATNLKIDLGAVSNWSDGKKQQQRDVEGGRSGADAGMAGVGRRGFAGVDYDGAPSPTYLHPQKPQTPPHAYFSLPPDQPHVKSQNQNSPYHIATQGASRATHNQSHPPTSTPARSPSPLPSAVDSYHHRPHAAASVSISISSPGSGPYGPFTQSTRHHPPGSYDSSSQVHVFSPATVPQTASSSSTMPATLYSKTSFYATTKESDFSAASVHETTSITTKGKGVAYPRPGVSPAEYTQRQQHLNRHTATVAISTTPNTAPSTSGTESSQNVKPTPDDAMQSYAQRGNPNYSPAAGSRGPLKVVNITPRPESIVAFQKQPMVVVPDGASGGAGKAHPAAAVGESIGSMVVSGVKKARGFMHDTSVTWASTSTAVDDGKQERLDGGGALGSEQQVDNLRWNVLRSALKRGMTSSSGDYKSESGASSSSPQVMERHTESAENRMSEMTTTSTTSGSTGGKLEFFERYKTMAEATATNPSLLPRSLSTTSPQVGPSIERQVMEQPSVVVGTPERRQHRQHRRRESRTRTAEHHVLESLREEPSASGGVLTESPIEARLEEAYMDDLESKEFAWTLQRGEKVAPAPGREETSASASRYKKGMGRKNSSSQVPPSRHHQTGRVQENGSISSLDSTQAERIKMGETNLLTPSTSMDQLAEGSHGRKVEASQEKEFTSTTRWDNDQYDPIEGLVDQPPPEPSVDASFDSMMSPNLSHATSSQSYRFQQRGSSASSLVAPSDSISTPGGFVDKFNVDHHSGTTLGREKLTPGTRACQKCGQSLKGKRFIDRDGIFLCEPDWKEMFLPSVSSTSG